MKRRLISLLTALLMAVTVLAAASAEQAAEALDPITDIRNEFAAAKNVEDYMVEVRPTRVSGWAAMRWAPSKAAPLLATYPARQALKVLKELPNWLQVENTETGDVGFIDRNYVQPLDQAAQAGAAMTDVAVLQTKSGKVSLGTIDINGAFTLQCGLPEGYRVAEAKINRERLTAAFTAEENPEQNPVMQLSVAFDKDYAWVARMNDLEDEAYAALEKTFTDVDPTVEITYGDTGLGTRLLIARQTEGDTDYINFLSIYKGYFVEFVMAPGSEAADKHLTDEQLSKCIDFLTDLDFVPVGQSESDVADKTFVTNLSGYDPETRTVHAVVMRPVILTKAEVDALKVGGTLTAGEYTAEIQSLEVIDNGEIEINGSDYLTPYGPDEYHLFFYEREYLEPMVEMDLKVPENLRVLDEVDPESGELLEEPAERTVDEFIEMLSAEGGVGFASENVYVTFDADSEMAQVQRFYNPYQ